MPLGPGAPAGGRRLYPTLTRSRSRARPVGPGAVVRTLHLVALAVSPVSPPGARAAVGSAVGRRRRVLAAGPPGDGSGASSARPLQGRPDIALESIWRGQQSVRRLAGGSLVGVIALSPCGSTSGRSRRGDARPGARRFSARRMFSRVLLGSTDTARVGVRFPPDHDGMRSCDESWGLNPTQLYLAGRALAVAAVALARRGRARTGGDASWAAALYAASSFGIEMCATIPGAVRSGCRTISGSAPRSSRPSPSGPSFRAAARAETRTSPAGPSPMNALLET